METQKNSSNPLVVIIGIIVTIVVVYLGIKILMGDNPFKFTTSFDKCIKEAESAYNIYQKEFCEPKNDGSGLCKVTNKDLHEKAKKERAESESRCASLYK